MIWLIFLYLAIAAVVSIRVTRFIIQTADPYYPDLDDPFALFFGFMAGLFWPVTGLLFVIYWVAKQGVVR